MNQVFEKKRYLVVTRWGYPFGGGEAYMRETLLWCLAQKMVCIWLSFTDAHNHPSLKLQVKMTDGYLSIIPPGGFSETSLTFWLKTLRPDIVHHQGHNRMEIVTACAQLRIPILTGYHFWIGLLKSVHEFSKMLDDSLIHRFEKDPERETLDPLCTMYVVSPYMKLVCQKLLQWDPPHILFPLATPPPPPGFHSDTKYVVMVNIHKQKGGEIALKLLENCPDIPFMLIRTEPQSTQLDELIMRAVIEHRAESFCVERVENMMNTVYSSARLVIVPSLVDETFCRVAIEALSQGVPTLVSNRGNLAHFNLPKTWVVTDESQWTAKVEAMYHAPVSTRKEYYHQSLVAAEPWTLKNKDRFLNLIQSLLTERIMIFAPWGDQGLGIQARSYVRSLESFKHIQTFIFSYLPYYCEQQKGKFQKQPQEWDHPFVYYSPNTREKVTDEEFIAFIEKYKIRKCLLPETCWSRVFELARLCRDHQVQCYAIPNIEIVRKSEVEQHRDFFKILSNNHLCHNFFTSRGMSSQWIGFFPELAHQAPPRTSSASSFASSMKFLCLGGMNAFTRKQIDKVCEAFVLACQTQANIHLTVTIQQASLGSIPTGFMQKYSTHPSIRIVTQHLSYTDILKLYAETDVCIQVSRHEGLGLGFYEALAMGCPIITLDTPPHNEIVTDMYGWRIPCTYEPVKENNESIMQAAVFQAFHLAQMIIELKDHPFELEKKISHVKQWNTAQKRMAFATTLLESL